MYEDIFRELKAQKLSSTRLLKAVLLLTRAEVHQSFIPALRCADL